MNPTARSWIRFALLALLLVATLGLLMARDREEALPPRIGLGNFPRSIAQWHGKDLQTSAEMAELLGPGEFLFRDYFNPEQRTASSLFIAYFPSQRMGDTIHSPKNCLPGAGWIPAETSRIWIDQQGGNKIQVNKILVTKGADRALVLYWYQAHGRSIPNEYVAKAYMISDAIRLNRTDGAIVRVITPLLPSESVEVARERVVRFTAQMSPSLSRFIPD